MTIPIGILAGAKQNGMTDRLVRVKTFYSGTGSSATVTFDEGTALNSTNLLVAVVQRSNNDLVTVTGWTELSGGGLSNSSMVRTYVRQGDGSLNSVSMTFGSSGQKSIWLMAFSGYSTLTPLAANGAAFASSPASISPSGSPSGVGVALAFFGPATSPITSESWSNGYAATGTSPNSSSRLRVGRKVFDSAVGTYGATFSWSSSASGRAQIVILPLV